MPASGRDPRSRNAGSATGLASASPPSTGPRRGRTAPHRVARRAHRSPRASRCRETSPSVETAAPGHRKELHEGLAVPLGRLGGALERFDRCHEVIAHVHISESNGRPLGAACKRTPVMVRPRDRRLAPGGEGDCGRDGEHNGKGALLPGHHVEPSRHGFSSGGPGARGRRGSGWANSRTTASSRSTSTIGCSPTCSS